MRRIVVCTETSWGMDPFDNIENYSKKRVLQAYSELFKTSLKQDVKMYKSNLIWYDKKKDQFTKGWSYSKKRGWIQEFNISFDSIWDKCPFTKEFIPFKKIFYKKGNILNHEFIERVASDKKITKEFLSDFMPRDYIINSKKDFIIYISQIRTNKFVLKPTIGSSAKGVVILNKGKYNLNDLDFSKQMLLQEYVQCRKNLFDFPYGVFDYRIIFNGYKIIDAFYRISREGVLTSNVSTGGRSINIPLGKITPKVNNLVKKIDNKLGVKKPRLYTLDFIVDENNNYWLIEINAKPGFTHFKKNEYWRRSYFEKGVIEVLKKLK